MFYKDTFDLALDVWYIDCSKCGQLCGPYSEDEAIEYTSLGGVADWLCFECWEVEDLIEPSILQSTEGDMYTFREDQPEIYTERLTKTGFTKLVIQEAKFISIEVTNGLPF